MIKLVVEMYAFASPWKIQRHSSKTSRHQLTNSRFLTDFSLKIKRIFKIFARSRYKWTHTYIYKHRFVKKRLDSMHMVWVCESITINPDDHLEDVITENMKYFMKTLWKECVQTAHIISVKRRLCLLINNWFTAINMNNKFCLLE